jgi:opacity protein-like surface antigen
MRNRINRRGKSLALAFAIAALLSAAYAANAKAAEIVAKHLDSIGTADARAAITSRAAQGTLRFKILVGGSGEAVGSWGRVSDHRKSNFVMRFGTGDWRGEHHL